MLPLNKKLQRRSRRPRGWFFLFSSGGLTIWTFVLVFYRLGGNDIHSNLAVCAWTLKQWSAQKLKLSPSGLEHVDFAWLRNHYGHMEIYAAESSRLKEDTTDYTDGGLSEEATTLSTFLDEMQSGRTDVRHNYLKLVDPYSHLQSDSGPVEDLQQLMPFGESIAQRLRASLKAQHSLEPPPNASFSLWLGCRGSTTAMHVDDQAFNVILVLRGAKRVVMIDPSASTFRCRRPKGNPHACWSGVDVLGQPPPNIPGLSEHILRDGEALIIPEMHWHSVENLEPTIAVGLNEINDCTGARFAKLRDPGAWFF